MRERVTANRIKTFRIRWKCIVVPLCRGTVIFCIEFSEKRMRGSNDTLNALSLFYKPFFLLNVFLWKCY